MDLEERVALVLRNAQEVLVNEEVRALLAREDHPKAYIGYEPSGLFTVGQLVTIAKVRDLAHAGFQVTVFLADWHALINDKLGGSLERIRLAGRAMSETFRALEAAEGVRFRWAKDLVASENYWARVIRCAKAMSLARAKRAVTIMGRKEDEAEVDAAKLFYPAMQVADIFELPVDLAYAGIDQRRAHVLAREVAHHYGWPVPVALHTPLISSLKGGGRMNIDDPGLMERKMSKSDPTSGIPVPSPDAVVEDRLKGAFCPVKEVEGNPVLELARYVVLPWLGKLEVERPAKYGGPLSFSKEEEFLATWKEGKLHPQDLKASVAVGLQRIMAPANRYFAEHPEALSALKAPG
ncbi:MAG: tyrosine--tRNA ligase [Euryarchaeota archaeon]|nr:tyrosine--tRNA ligase [Euryarchaeota archaeon]MDE1835595.1 tyrosine--tRNA ligase [Euryarchaeota archaeon]MDE1878943.1 tyrosine--tRNA ligase [Euryarchaeota archaeon]MDE2043783.1 tyrosine--tRNA ligase [Thermoplasmata archaeon]